MKNSNSSIDLSVLLHFVSAKTNWSADALITAVETTNDSSKQERPISRQAVITLLQQRKSWGKKQLTTALELEYEEQQSITKIEQATTTEKTSQPTITDYIKQGKFFINNNKVVVYGDKRYILPFYKQPTTDPYTIKQHLLAATTEQITTWINKYINKAEARVA